MTNRETILNKFSLTFIILGILFASSSPLLAQGGTGVRIGVSIDPDQIYFGGHFEAGPVMESLWVRPNLEVGIGNGITSISLNFELAYWIPLESRSWKTYIGAGPALNVYIVDTGVGGRDSKVKPGFNILMALAHRDGLFTELKLGALDSPDLKFGIGYTWK
ncbi:MAG: hypothetical protein ACE1ZI_02740 [Acidobacteriota bacterium]